MPRSGALAGGPSLTNLSQHGPASCRRDTEIGRVRGGEDIPGRREQSAPTCQADEGGGAGHLQVMLHGDGPTRALVHHDEAGHASRSSSSITGMPSRDRCLAKPPPTCRPGAPQGPGTGGHPLVLGPVVGSWRVACAAVAPLRDPAGRSVVCQHRRHPPESRDCSRGARPCVSSSPCPA